MPDLPRPTTYQALTGAATEFAKTLPRKQARRVDVGRFRGIPAAVGETRARGEGVTPASLKNIGVQTTPYMGQTRYEARHPGVDIGAPTGTIIPATTSGTVVDVRSGMGRTVSPSFGNFVTIQDDKGNYHRYSHLSQSWIPVNTRVTTGQPIGAVGTSGSVYSLHGGTGAHLDYRIWKEYQGQKQYFDPSAYLNQI